MRLLRWELDSVRHRQFQIRKHKANLRALNGGDSARADQLTYSSASRAVTCHAPSVVLPVRKRGAAAIHPRNVHIRLLTGGPSHPWMEVDAISFRRRDCCVRDWGGFLKFRVQTE